MRRASSIRNEKLPIGGWGQLLKHDEMWSNSASSRDNRPATAGFEFPFVTPIFTPFTFDLNAIRNRIRAIRL